MVIFEFDHRIFDIKYCAIRHVVALKLLQGLLSLLGLAVTTYSTGENTVFTAFPTTTTSETLDIL